MPNTTPKISSKLVATDANWKEAAEIVNANMDLIGASFNNVPPIAKKLRIITNTGYVSSVKPKSIQDATFQFLKSEAGISMVAMKFTPKAWMEILLNVVAMFWLPVLFSKLVLSLLRAISNTIRAKKPPAIGEIVLP